MAEHFTVLLVEDDEHVRRALKLALVDQGFAVLDARDGREAVRQLRPSAGVAPDLVLLDLALPDIDGMQVLQRIRETGDLPVIIVTGRSGNSDVVAGLECGADDYVTKPVAADVLTARIHALLRRAAPAGPAPDEVVLGDVVLRPHRQEVRKNGRELQLTRTEFALLRELAATPGSVVTREQLLQRVWGYDYFGDTRLLDVHIRRLRMKIEDDPGDPRLIATVRGVGYKVLP